MSGLFVVLIHPEAHAILAPAFPNYLFERDSVHYFLSASAPQSGQFLSLLAVAKDNVENMTKTLDVQIPLGYVLGIVAMQDGKNPLGFLSQNT